MFAKKPIPPHCESLTPAQIKFVHKVMNCSSHTKMYKLAAFAFEQNWPEVFVALAQIKIKQHSIYKETFFEGLIKYDDGRIMRQAMPLMAELNDSHHGNLIAKALRKCDGAAAQAILAAPVSANIRARAAAHLIYEGEGVAKKNLLQLLAAPTNLHYEGGMLMKYALHHERFDVAQALVEHGFDVALYATDIRDNLIESKSPHSARVWLDKHTEAPAPAAAMPAPQVLVQDGQGYLRSGDCASRVDTLPDGGSLTTVFNFATCQQIVIAHVAGQTAAPAVTPFSQIEGSVALTEAAAAFVRQGGAPERVYGVTMTAARPTLLEKPARVIAKPAAGDSP